MFYAKISSSQGHCKGDALDNRTPLFQVGFDFLFVLWTAEEHSVQQHSSSCPHLIEGAKSFPSFLPVLLFYGKVPALITKFWIHNSFHQVLQQNNLRLSGCTSLLVTLGNIKWIQENPAGVNTELRAGNIKGMQEEPAGVNAELKSLFKRSGASSLLALGRWSL